MPGKNLTVETDEDLNAYIVVECSSCRRKHRKKIGSLRPMIMVTCLCGSLLPIKSGDIRKAARRVEALKHLIDKLEEKNK